MMGDILILPSHGSKWLLNLAGELKKFLSAI